LHGSRKRPKKHGIAALGGCSWGEREETATIDPGGSYELEMIAGPKKPQTYSRGKQARKNCANRCPLFKRIFRGGRERGFVNWEKGQEICSMKTPEDCNGGEGKKEPSTGGRGTEARESAMPPTNFKPRFGWKGGHGGIAALRGTVKRSRS